MAIVPTKPRTAIECVEKTMGLERVRDNDVRELAILSARRSGIALHGSIGDLTRHDARRAVRQRHHDLAVEDIASSHTEHEVAVLREAFEAAGLVL